ncbi:hypothetical protein CMO95_02390 [Candidatus Woesearchaeota archaeon]|nr:hypothetical protein [Candidatus Woesearchaeota archaeon]
MGKKFSTSLILFLLLPMIIVFITESEITIDNITIFQFNDENGNIYDGSVKIENEFYKLYGGEVEINNSLLYYFDVSTNNLVSKGDVYAYLINNNVTLSYKIDIHDNTSNYNRIPIVVDSSDFKIKKYDMYRYNNSLIKYNFLTECSWNELTKFDKAFDEISKNTILNFEETNETAQLYISCFDYNNKNEEGNYILGKGAPSWYNDQTKTIINGTVNLYKQSEAKKCIKYPVTEIHEILHGLNFAHVDKEESIMHPGIGGDLCTEIDEDIINCINSIYSNSEINCNNVDFILK